MMNLVEKIAKFTLQNKVLAGYCIISLFLLFMRGSFYLSYHGMREAVDQRGEVYRARIALEDVHADLQDAKTAQSDYLLTHNPYFLAPLHVAARREEKNIRLVTALLEKNPAAYEHLSEFKKLRTEIMGEIQKSIALERSGRSAEARALVESGKMQNLMDQAHVQMTAIQSILSQQRETEEERVLKGMNQTLWLASLFGLSIFLILLALYFSLRNEIKNRDIARDQLNRKVDNEAFIINLMREGTEKDSIQELMDLATRKTARFFHADRCWSTLRENDQLFCFSKFDTTQCPPFGTQDLPDPVLRKSVISLFDQDEKTRVPYQIFNRGETTGIINDYLERNSIQTILVTGIYINGKFWGVVCLQECSKTRVWTRDEIALLGELSLYLSVMIEKQMLLEKMASTNRQKTRLLSFVAHDFKNPLNAMNWILENLQHDNAKNLTGDQKEGLEHLKHGIRHLYNMVQDMLEKTRIESGNLKLRAETIEIKKLIEGVKILVGPMADKRGITTTYRVEPTLTHFEGDVTQMRQVLLNLISNGIKFNRPGGRVDVSFRKSPDQQAVLIKVSDTGIGISKEQLPRLFEDFYRGTLHEEDVEGTGLGLACIKKIIELHGGTLEIESREGMGSTFTIRLPQDHPVDLIAKPEIQISSLRIVS